MEAEASVGQRGSGIRTAAEGHGSHHCCLGGGAGDGDAVQNRHVQDRVAAGSPSLPERADRGIYSLDHLRAASGTSSLQPLETGWLNQRSAEQTRHQE